MIQACLEHVFFAFYPHVLDISATIASEPQSVRQGLLNFVCCVLHHFFNHCMTDVLWCRECYIRTYYLHHVGGQDALASDGAFCISWLSLDLHLQPGSLPVMATLTFCRTILGILLLVSPSHTLLHAVCISTQPPGQLCTVICRSYHITTGT